MMWLAAYLLLCVASKQSMHVHADAATRASYIHDAEPPQTRAGCHIECSKPDGESAGKFNARADVLFTVDGAPRSLAPPPPPPLAAPLEACLDCIIVQRCTLHNLILSLTSLAEMLTMNLTPPSARRAVSALCCRTCPRKSSTIHGTSLIWL